MSSTRSSIGYAIALLVVASGIGVYLGSVLSKGSGTSQMAPPILRTSDEANRFIDRAEKLSADVLERFDRGQKPTEREKDDLKEAANIFAGVRAFESSRPAPYFLEGKIRYALEEHQKALDLMQQVIILSPPPKPAPPQEVIQMVAEAHYVSSRCLFFLGRYEAAATAGELACTMAPTSANYAVARAAAEAQLPGPEHEQEAVRLVFHALLLDPNHVEARGLAKLLKVSVDDLPKPKAPGKDVKAKVN